LSRVENLEDIVKRKSELRLEIGRRVSFFIDARLPADQHALEYGAMGKAMRLPPGGPANPRWLEKSLH
jgi:hypothetical protein